MRRSANTTYVREEAETMRKIVREMVVLSALALIAVLLVGWSSSPALAQDLDPGVVVVPSGTDDWVTTEPANRPDDPDSGTIVDVRTLQDELATGER